MTMLEVQDVCKYFGGVVALDNCSFQVKSGKIYGLVGPNGAGKTTLFNCITGFLKPDKGSIKFKGKNIGGLLPHETCNMGISRTFQRVKPLLEMKVIENVMVGAFKNMKNTQDAKRKAEDVLRSTSLYEERNKLAANLNTGGRKRMELARSLAGDPELLLLDEIVAGLNPQEMDEIAKLLKIIKSEGITLIVVEHVMDFVMPLSDEVMVLNKGKLIAKGLPQEVIKHPMVIEAYLGKREDVKS